MNTNFKKSILFILSIIIGVLGFSNAESINYKGKDFNIIENTSIKGKQVNLLNKRVTIENNNKKEFSSDNNINNIVLSGGLNNEYTITGDKISFQCSGDIVYSSGENTFLKGGLEFMYLQLEDNTKNYQLQVGCRPKEKQKTSSPKDSLPFNEEDTNGSAFSTYSISSSNSSGIIKQNNITKKLKKTNPGLQPTFTDILYLQIKTIGNLNQSLQALGINNLSGVFETTQDYNNYIKWNNKFNQFTNKKSFVDALSGAIVLKDLGIGADIIKGLSKRLKCEINNNSCTEKVYINKNYEDKYDFYSMNDISNKIYNSSSNGIGNNFISLYSGLQNIDTSSLTGSEKDMVENFLENMFSNIEESITKNYKIGFGLSKRKKNLEILRDKYFQNISGTGKVNLLGIYNFFYEVNNVVKGTENLSMLKNSIDNGEVNNFFMSDLPKVIIEEKKDLKASNITGFITGNGIQAEIEEKLYQNFSGEYNDKYISGINYIGDCFTYNTGNIVTEEDIRTTTQGVASIVSMVEGESFITIEINLGKLWGTKYQQYIRPVKSNFCRNVPYTSKTITGSITTEEIFSGNLYNQVNDLSGNDIKFMIDDSSNNGLNIDNNGNYIFSGNIGSGNYNITTKAKDKFNNTSDINIRIKVEKSNNPPIISGATLFSISNNKILSGNLYNIFNDPEGDSLSFSTGSNPSNGVISIQNSWFEYTPNDYYSGQDSFEIVADDGNGGSVTATMNIEVKDELKLVGEANYDNLSKHYNDGSNENEREELFYGFSGTNFDIENGQMIGSGDRYIPEYNSSESKFGTSKSVNDLTDGTPISDFNKDNNIIEFDGKQGVFIDNAGYDSFLKYDISSLNLDETDKFAIEISLRGAALKRSGNDYKIFELNSYDSTEDKFYDLYKFYLNSGKLHYNNNSEYESTLLDDLSLQDYSFYKIRTEFYKRTEDITISIVNESGEVKKEKTYNNIDYNSISYSNLYIGSEPTYNDGSKHYMNQRNDIINFVKIYK